NDIQIDSFNNSEEETVIDEYENDQTILADITNEVPQLTTDVPQMSIIT
ncbi:12088_t:CDS:2, partial [Funneliformis geosporum]